MTQEQQLELTERNYPRPWTTAELAVLREQGHLGSKALAQILDRSVQSVKHVAHRHGISLRRRGERRGLLLGQPKNSSWKGSTEAIPAERLERIRVAARSGDLDLEELYRRIREQVANPNRPICPKCASRPQEKPATGLCAPCHYRELARVHRDHEALTEAKRELWRARQARSREGRAKRAGESEQTLDLGDEE
jgi:hypothetical protein